MPTFEVEWSAQGLLTVEADDEAEARTLTIEGIQDLDSVPFEAIDVTRVEVTNLDVRP